MSRKHAILYGASFLCAAIFTGCGIGTITTSGGGGTMSLAGQVYGGQQGVKGATIQLYTVGTGGNGTGATPMLTQTVTTDSGGNFNFIKDFTCGENSGGTAITSSNQVYLVATGGDPGVGTNNPALTMVTAVGPCSSLSSKSTVFVNELTTVAAAWALAPFATSAANISSSSTNDAGVTNAFLDAGLLVNPSSGALATLPGNLAVETGKVAALADALASCVNSNGGSSCTPLFSAATDGSTVPTDTFTAALNVVKNPGQNVAKVFNAIGTYVPYPTSLDSPPNDWTMSLSVTGGGLSNPKGLAVDTGGNVWVTNYSGPLSAFGPQGAPLSDTGFGAGDLSQSTGVAVDSNNDVWVTSNLGGVGFGDVTKFYGATSSSGTPGTAVLNGATPGYTDHIYYPFAIAADTNGNMFVANSQNGSATVLTTSGTVYTTPPPMNTYSGYLGLGYGFPQGIAVDTNHGFWLPDGDHNVGHFSADGVLESDTTCCYKSVAVATDSSGNAWVANYLGFSFSEVGSDGSSKFTEVMTGGLSFPNSVSIDAAQNAWFANYSDSAPSLSEIAGNSSANPGSGLSPTTGEYGTGGFGLDANLDFPVMAVPDRSGNIWVSSSANDTVVMFFGLGTPTITPLQPVPTAP